MKFSLTSLVDHLKPVAVAGASVFGYLTSTEFVPKNIFLGLVIWQILTRGAALVDAFKALYNFVKSIFTSSEDARP